MREGRIGKQEGFMITALALTVSALYAPSSRMAYADGNSAQLTIPLAMGVSLLLFLLVRRAMAASGAEDLNGLFTAAFGRAGVLCSLVLVFALIYCSYRPLIHFLDVMSNLIFVDSGGRRIAVYIIPVVAFAALLGFEAQARSARLYAPLFASSMLITVITSAESFAPYRMFPLVRDGIGEAAAFSLSSTVLFLPPLLGVLMCARGFHGLKTAGRLASWAALAAGVISALMLTALALTFTSGELEGTLMPLSKLNTKMQQEIGVVRLDKLAVFVWLSGAMLATSWSVYLASLTFARAFGQNDVRPAAVCLSALLFGACVFGEGGSAERMQRIIEGAYGLGGAAVAGVVLAASLTAVLRKRRKLNA